MDDSPSLIITIALALSLSMGFFDITLSLLERPSGLSFFTAMFPPLAVTVSIFFLAYLVLWFGVVSRLGRVFNLRAIPMAVSLAVFLGLVRTVSPVI